jgi:hypothetical protein
MKISPNLAIDKKTKYKLQILFNEHSLMADELKTKIGKRNQSGDLFLKSPDFFFLPIKKRNPRVQGGAALKKKTHIFVE